MKLWKILVTGSRNWTDRAAIRRELLIEMQRAVDKGRTPIVIHGNAAGADLIADSVANALGMHRFGVNALWGIGLRAGPLRNSVMVALEPDIGIAFHPDIAKSKGTKDCVLQMQANNIDYRIVTG